MRCFVTVLCLSLLTPVIASAQSIQGVWEGVEMRIIGGPNDGQVTPVQPRLLIYTEAYFMWAFVTGTEPRPLLPPPGEATDEQVAAAARQYLSVAGTYIRDGATLTYNRLISSIPNLMAPENQPQAPRTIRLLTKNRLETQVTNAEGVTTVLVYRRVE